MILIFFIDFFILREKIIDVFQKILMFFLMFLIFDDFSSKTSKKHQFLKIFKD